MNAGVTIPNGAFAFTTTGALAGLVVGQPERPAIVPAERVISVAHRLLEEDPVPIRLLGIQVQPLTLQLQTATGVNSGVVVTSVNAQSAASGKVFPTDIIEAAGGHVIETRPDWESFVTRLTAGDTIVLRIRRVGRTEEVEITLPEEALVQPSRLGLTMRAMPGVGTEVLDVEEGSAARRAGMEIDDVITRVGNTPAPTPQQITRAFAAAMDQALLVAVTRGSKYFVVPLIKQ
jgi:serine protease Do